ncbi:universal stress protein [Nitrogeniibacter mangrovi]|uniref:Universal stress protein n=1 Tax=Nitrogeniibacter mangrovi TaxID=2016596 RepID=A0A6C1B1E5_9RHOO|nr:universal stress protein [Nitrogeniibacter mangrovi]QID17183.1 universal stress protein [Nitrogeniibacter mangrovi]
MYQHIVAAIDDSDTSRRAIREAVALAQSSGASLTLVHAVDEALFAHFSHTTLANRDAVEKALIAEGQNVLDAAAQVAADAGMDAQTRLLTSKHQSTSDQVAEALRALHADLLVVGSHGRRGVQRLVLGSVAERLLKKVTISVLIVRGIAPD